MEQLLFTARTDIIESIRTRWFALYSLVFGLVIVLLFVSGLTESRVMGHTGLSRVLITYIQITMAILPIFILITTVRSISGDREAGVFEYILSFPVSLRSWYWGKVLGRFFVVFVPVLLAMAVSLLLAPLSDDEVPWSMFFYYAALLLALSWCFLGIAMLISTMARTTDVAQGASFIIWLTFILLLDLIILGLMVNKNISPELAVGISLVNPLQVFRTAAMMLFDARLVLLGPSAFIILDTFGNTGYMIWSVVYPVVVGSICAITGFFIFRNSDLP